MAFVIQRGEEAKSTVTSHDDSLLMSQNYIILSNLSFLQPKETLMLKT